MKIVNFFYFLHKIDYHWHFRRIDTANRQLACMTIPGMACLRPAILWCCRTKQWPWLGHSKQLYARIPIVARSKNARLRGIMCLEWIRTLREETMECNYEHCRAVETGRLRRRRLVLELNYGSVRCVKTIGWAEGDYPEA